MNDIVYRVNYILSKNNEQKLLKENIEKDKKIVEFSEECKRIVTEGQENNLNRINELTEKISVLESEKEVISKERDFYKDSLNKIPNIFLKIFGISKKDGLLN